MNVFGLSLVIRAMKLFLPAVFLVLCLTLHAEQCLVIGDSLSKEYEVEFPALYPRNPASWDSRNWAEILHERRKTWFDLGKWSAFADPRLVGHEHNWAFPGSTTTQIKMQLGSFWNVWWTRDLQSQIRGSAERVVIFAGGNDVDNYYPAIYKGASPTAYINSTRDNLKWIVDYVRRVKGTIPIALVSVPHVGCTPDIQKAHPTDAVKTRRVTLALDSLNAQLALFATQRGIAFVPGVYEMTKSMISKPMTIGAVSFISAADADARPEYVFSGDGFHPGSAAQAKIAQMIVNAFRAKYPKTVITPLTDEEILKQVLGL
jgi:lysophospholipase L1-like esterase